MEALDFLAKTYDIRFYSLCPNSPLSRYFPLAPITNNTFLPKDKPKDYINDILLPSKYAYAKFNMLDKYRANVDFKQSIYFKILKDTYRLPLHIRQFLRYYKRRKNK